MVGANQKRAKLTHRRLRENENKYSNVCIQRISIWSQLIRWPKRIFNPNKSWLWKKALTFIKSGLYCTILLLVDSSLDKKTSSILRSSLKNDECKKAEAENYVRPLNLNLVLHEDEVYDGEQCVMLIVARDSKLQLRMKSAFVQFLHHIISHSTS